MVIISFQNRSDWFRPNWVFRQIVADTVATFPDDTELKFVMEKAQAFGGLPLETMERNVAVKTLDALRRVAEDTLQGRISGWKATRPDEDKGQRMYLDSLTELLELPKAQDH